jgi:cyclase
VKLPIQCATDVSDGILAIIQESGEMGVSNSAAVIENGHALVVDTMLLPEMAHGITETLRFRGARAVLVLNTHHHIDHIGGNVHFSSCPIIAHPVAVEIIRQMSADTTVATRLIPRFAAEIPRRLQVPESLYNRLTASESLPGGGELLTFSPAHTAADVAVWMPEQRVLLAGDLCFNGVTPLAIHGRLQDWVAALEILIALAPVVVVPGHGPLATVATLETLHSYLQAMTAVARRIAAGEITMSDSLEMFDPGDVGNWLEPGRTMMNLRQAVREAQQEVVH